MSYYTLNTNRKVIEKGGRFKFQLLYDGDILDHLRNLENSEWSKAERIPTRRRHKRPRHKMPVDAGVYALVVGNTKTGKVDVAYVGSSICLHDRIKSHRTLDFLLCKLHPDFFVDVYYTLVPNGYRGVEAKAAKIFKPFLIKEDIRIHVTF